MRSLRYRVTFPEQKERLANSYHAGLSRWIRQLGCLLLLYLTSRLISTERPT